MEEEEAAEAAMFHISRVVQAPSMVTRTKCNILDEGIQAH